LFFPEIELRQRLVGEAVAHHEARMAGRAAQVHQAAFGQHEDAVAALEGVLIHLRLDVQSFFTPCASFSFSIWISLSKWPMLQTIAWSFIFFMCSSVMMSTLPVQVT
jgi:hypothetical protein